MPIPWLDQFGVSFPDIECALKEPNGLLAVGGDLSRARLIAAYRQGIFPWFEKGQPILWWSPDPRMVLFPNELRISASMQKIIRKQLFNITVNQDFKNVVIACSSVQKRSSGTWITSELISAYCDLHDAGIAHSVEVWDENGLVGGLYGLAIGKLFFGESMFSRKANTSKLALIALVKVLRKWNFQVIDCQVPTAHLESLGAREISRTDFKVLLSQNLDSAGIPGKWQTSVDLKEYADEF